MERILGFLRKAAQDGLLAWESQGKAARTFGVGLSALGKSKVARRPTESPRSTRP